MSVLNVLLCALGLALYGLLALMAARAPRRGERTAPLLGAGIAGIVWHATTLLLFDTPGRLPDRWASWLLAAGLFALGFLPTFALEAAVAAKQPLRRGLRLAAYGSSLIGGLIQLAAAARGDTVPQPTPLLWLVGVQALLVGVVLVTRHGRDASRIARGAGLGLFAVSALHVAGHATGTERELDLLAVLAHHAAIPLAVALLLQDFPASFADLFLKRAARLTALMGLAGGATVLLWPSGGQEGTLVVVTAVVAAAMLAPPLWRLVDAGVDRIWIGRPARDDAAATITAALSRAEDESTLLSDVTSAIGRATGGRPVRIEREAALTSGAWLVQPVAGGRDGASVRVPTIDAPTYILRVGTDPEGRRLLSDDLALLEWTARELARRVDALRREAERRTAAAREAEMQRLASEAELRALRAQLNPHFLFNALTTLGWLMDEAPNRAKETLYRLTGLLRAVLGRTEGTLDAGTLGEEMSLLEDYLAIEAARFEDRLVVEIDVPEALDTILVPPLVLQPLVENAVKHGISPRREGGRLQLVARAHSGAQGEELHVHVRDSGAGFDPAQLPKSRNGGVGLANVRARVQLHGGALTITSQPGVGTEVAVILPATRRRLAPTPTLSRT